MKDKVVEEIRSRRRELIRVKYQGSVDKFVRGAIEWEHQHPDRVIHTYPREGQTYPREGQT